MCAHVSNWWSKFSQFSSILVNSVLKLNIVCKKNCYVLIDFINWNSCLSFKLRKFFYTFFSTCLYVLFYVLSGFVSFILKLFIQIYYFCTYLYAFVNVLALHIYVRNSFESNFFLLLLMSGHIFLKKDILGTILKSTRIFNLQNL